MQLRFPWAIAAALILAGPAVAQEVSRAEVKAALEEQVREGQQVGADAPARAGGPRVGRTRSATTRSPGFGDDKIAAAPVAKPLVFRQIQFAFDSAELTSASGRTLDALAGGLADAMAEQQFRGVRFPIVGHTDAKGTAGYNLQLSQRRAETVVRYLVARGIPSDRLMAVGRGAQEPADPRNPEAAENRRVEVRTQL